MPMKNPLQLLAEQEGARYMEASRKMFEADLAAERENYKGERTCAKCLHRLDESEATIPALKQRCDECKKNNFSHFHPSLAAIREAEAAASDKSDDSNSIKKMSLF